MQRRPISALIAELKPRIVDRFVAEVRAHELPARPLSTAQVVNHLRTYLDELIDALSRSPEEQDNSSLTASQHGEQRWYVGYDLRTVLLEYGVLREVILSELEGTGEAPSVRDFDRIAQFLDIGLADAAVEFMAKTTDQLDRALEEARAASQAREDVLAIVSHDLRGPLQVVYTSARIMRQQLAQGATDPLGVSLDRVERAASKMDRLTGALLDLARLKSGEMSVQVQEERSEDLLREALEHAAPLADERAITLEIGTTEAGVVRCDRERLLQVLSNLVGNAIKFTEKGGMVSVSAWCASREWTFSVRDGGPGIAPERVPFIFERFWHGGGKEGGTGLGLAIAKGLVELHSGRIWVESAPGLGATFYFTVPRAAAMGRAPRAALE